MSLSPREFGNKISEINGMLDYYKTPCAIQYATAKQISDLARECAGVQSSLLNINYKKCARDYYRFIEVGGLYQLKSLINCDIAPYRLPNICPNHLYTP